MPCPNCKQELEDGAVVCGACDHVVDEQFFTGELTDLTSSTPTTDEALALPPISQEQGDPVILGDVSGEFDVVLTEETGSYLHAASSASDEQGPLRPAPVYVDAAIAQLCDPRAVLAARTVDLPPLTPFESHVLSLLDGQRTVEEAHAMSGLSLDDLRIAICMLADKGIVSMRLGSPDRTDTIGPVSTLLDALRGVTLSSSAPSGEAVAEGPVVMDAAELELTPIAAPPAAPAPSEDDARAKAAAAYEQALADIRAGRFSRGRMLARLAVSLDAADPRYADLLERWNEVREEAAAEPPAPPAPPNLLQQALEAERARDFATAVRLLEQAIEQAPNSATLHNRLGALLATRLKDYERAANALFRAVELAPENSTFKHNFMKVVAAAEAAGPAAPKKHVTPLLPGQEPPPSRWAFWKKKLF